MARLFGGFPAPSPFFNGYEAEWPSPLATANRATLLQPVKSPASTHAKPLWRWPNWQQAEARVWELNKLIGPPAPTSSAD